jgi:hypothetical protein
LKKTLFASILILLTFTSGEAELAIQTNEEGKIYAHLQNVSLVEVKNFLEQNFEIRFRGDITLYQTPVTLSFDNLTLEKALQRIFSRTSFVIKYDSLGKITEVDVFPSDGKKYPAGSAKNGNARRLAVNRSLGETHNLNLGIQDLQVGSALHNYPDILTPDAAFQAMPHSSAHDDSLPGDVPPPPPRDSFMNVPNSPPPGGSSQIFPSSPPSRK